MAVAVATLARPAAIRATVTPPVPPQAPRQVIEQVAKHHPPQVHASGVSDEVTDSNSIVLSPYEWFFSEGFCELLTSSNLGSTNSKGCGPSGRAHGCCYRP
jgi:hypothetical protein